MNRIAAIREQMEEKRLEKSLSNRELSDFVSLSKGKRIKIIKRSLDMAGTHPDGLHPDIIRQMAKADAKLRAERRLNPSALAALIELGFYILWIILIGSASISVLLSLDAILASDPANHALTYFLVATGLSFAAALLSRCESSLRKKRERAVERLVNKAIQRHEQRVAERGLGKDSQADRGFRV